MWEILLNIKNSFRIADLFDLLIIFVMIYSGIRWFRRTSSRTILIGLGFFGILYTFAYSFHLYMTAIVLKNFFGIALIAIVIIFQEDIKRFFERIAVVGLVHTKNKQLSSTRDIDILANTMTKLAKRRTGALVVLKGKDPLDRHLKGCVSLDGKLSDSLLESIFDPSSAGHDGAAVYEDGKIIKFGCQLPLSTSFHKLSRTGTRHMAGLGLAESTDAMCIIVSEERGIISVAHEENIFQVDSDDSLRNMIKRFYAIEQVSPAYKQNWFQRIKEHPLEKLMAIVLTMFLWLVFGYRSEILLESYRVPIEYKNVPEELYIEDISNRNVTVTLEGPEREFFLLNRNSLKVIIDLATISSGKQEISLDRSMLILPANMTVQSIEPSIINIDAVQMVRLKLPVVVPAIGILNDYLALTGTKVTPGFVSVMVPIQMKDKYQKVLTEPLDFDKIQSTSTLKLRLRPEKGTYIVKNEPEEVEVKVDVVEKKNKLELDSSDSADKEDSEKETVVQP